jgi:hypothetical protein
MSQSTTKEEITVSAYQKYAAEMGFEDDDFYKLSSNMQKAWRVAVNETIRLTGWLEKPKQLDYSARHFVTLDKGGVV